MMNKVGNKVVEVPKGIELNEKDYCLCLLTTLKDMEKNYVVAMTEASNDFLYEHYLNVFTSLSDYQRKIYMIMFQKGWYQLEALDAKKINEKYDLLSTEYQSLSE